MRSVCAIGKCLCFALLLNCVNVWADINVSNSGTEGFPLVGTDCQATFVIDSLDAEVVSTVAGCVITDVKTVTGKTLQLAHELQVGQFPIIAGTVGQSRWVDRLVAEGKVDTTGVTGRWEAYTLQLIENPSEGISQALVILGGTPRGTAYGLFEVSRRIGVSPYIWWADVKPAPQSTLYLSGDRTEVESPSVQYRGLFINDEDWAMLPWAKNTIDQAVKNIGPNTYAQLMELLLRLRANCLWPAKHAQSQAFWSLEANKRLAKKWAIVMSSGDSMLRDNLWEWRRFSGTGSEGFSFAYNSAQITDYWAKRAGESRDYEAIYDIGMRGLQDVALLGYEGQEAQLQGLTDIIAAQRKIITDSLGGDPTRVPQIYIPYKEALTLYNAGLKIPDDVTLCWVDDNYAYIRQLPTAAEQLRSGGNGIYYHLSYLGNPCSYIWLSTISPSLISYELSKAYENGMKRFWMVNVGDLKPAEVEFEFCMELAWNVHAWTPEKAWTFSRWWAAKTFGEDYADELAEIRLEHYRLAAQSKPETVREVTFSIGEMEQRIQDYQNLEARVNAMESQIPARLRDAYFQLFTYPIVATAHQNYKLLGANLSFWYAAMGNRTKALSYASQARVSYQRITSLTSKYNTGIQGGKWKGMMNMSPNASSTSQFGMPQVASSLDVNEVQGSLPEYSMQTVDAASYTDSRGAWTTIKNLGVGGQSVTVWPIDYNTYTTTTARTRAPYVEYTLPLKKGNYQIVVRCLPTFPITTDNDLVVGLSVNSGVINTQSITANAETNKWSDNVMFGYSEARFQYNAQSDRDYRIRIYAMNPAIVISQLAYRQTDTEDLDLTNKLLVNADFEQYMSGNSVLTNTPGGLHRGVPYGWQQEGIINGHSYGISDDGSITYKEGSSVCWYMSKPMPDDFKLYQTIPASKLEPGIYEVGCMLFVHSGKRGSCRFFANNHSQYYAHKQDYDQILKSDEINSFAGYKAGYSTHPILHPMRIVLAVNEGENLTVGIKSGNLANDGAHTDDTGRFSVDHFTIRRIGDLPGQEGNSVQNTPSEQPSDVADSPIIYNMAGVAVGKGWENLEHMQKGIYIIEGRKVLR